MTKGQLKVTVGGQNYELAWTLKAFAQAERRYGIRMTAEEVDKLSANGFENMSIAEFVDMLIVGLCYQNAEHAETIVDTLTNDNDLTGELMKSLNEATHAAVKDATEFDQKKGRTKQ